MVSTVFETMKPDPSILQTRMVVILFLFEDEERNKSSNTSQEALGMVGPQVRNFLQRI